MKVLVVDDSPTMRRIVVQMLKRLGYKNIVEADHGKDALARLKAEGNFELLLTDWNMPIMNGLELVHRPCVPTLSWRVYPSLWLPRAI